MIFYILVYSLASLGAFGVVAVLTATLGRDAEISDFNGCWKTTPGLAIAFLVFVLSLAGIPPLPGFLGNFTFSSPPSGPRRKPPLGTTDFTGLSPSPS